MKPQLGTNEFLSKWEAGLRRAEARKDWRIEKIEGPALGDIPGSLASAPVRFVDVRDGSEHSLRFVGGLFDVTQDVETGALAPEFGWTVVHEPQRTAGQLAGS